MVLVVKNLPAMQQTWVRPLGREDPLEEAMVTQSSLLAWRIPMDRGAWWATVYRTAKSQTRLKQLGPLQLLGSIPGPGRPHMPWSN